MRAINCNFQKSFLKQSGTNGILNEKWKIKFTKSISIFHESILQKVVFINSFLFYFLYLPIWISFYLFISIFFKNKKKIIANKMQSNSKILLNNNSILINVDIFFRREKSFHRLISLKRKKKISYKTFFWTKKRKSGKK